MQRSRRLLALAAGTAFFSLASTVPPFGAAAHARPGPRYTITDLGTLPAGSFTDAGNINDRGDVTGAGDVGSDAGEIAPRGFAWKDGKLTDIGTLGGPEAVAGPMNNSGQLTGWADLSSPAPPSIFNTEGTFCGPPPFPGDHAVACRAFLADHGRKADLGTLGGLNSAAENKGINQHGHVAGVAETAIVDPTSPIDAPVFHAFLWRSGTMLDLGTLGARADSVANAVNDFDQVAGADVAADAQEAVGWLWQTGRKTALGTLGGSWSVPFAVNDRGQVAGVSGVEGDAAAHAFLWQRGRMTDLGAPSGRTDSEALDINERGQVVAMSCEPDGCVPYLWQGGTFTDLNSLLPPSSGWQLNDAGAINERGQIVGGGFHNGEFHAYLLTPVN
jgi:probable HAF family extracellular repeat protein